MVRQWEDLVDVFCERFAGIVSRRQLQAYVLVHPEFGAMDGRDAADLLDIRHYTLQKRLATMRRNLPHAFNWTRGPRRIPKARIREFRDCLEPYIVAVF